MNPGDPGKRTWPNLDAARHGGGFAWIPGVYDPETKLYIFGTGNPTPGYTGAGRPGDNLFTCSLVAVHVDTGKMAWYFQTSGHDTHDWDSARISILIDATINGRRESSFPPRLAMAILHPGSRDRRTHRHVEVRVDFQLGEGNATEWRDRSRSFKRSHDSGDLSFHPLKVE